MNQIKYLFMTLFVILTLTGCASSALSSPAGPADAGSDHVDVGNHLTVDNTDSRLTLLSNMDALSADGLYYASWAMGSSEPYENSDGDTVDLYDAQLYLLSGEFKDTEAAQTNMDAWLAAGKANYDILSEENVTCSGQDYLLITYQFPHEENPYARGASAFGVFDNTAVCIELTCRESFEEDLKEILTGFLEGCTYHAG
ncbi:MAG: hypothetical protein NC341_07255 [Blautia sp.]|nr:hypothetical protein [Blautia sp.]MCM1199737.1 hypothetical protein [Bacteroides fragilis]